MVAMAIFSKIAPTAKKIWTRAKGKISSVAPKAQSFVKSRFTSGFSPLKKIPIVSTGQKFVGGSIIAKRITQAITTKDIKQLIPSSGEAGLAIGSRFGVPGAIVGFGVGSAIDLARKKQAGIERTKGELQELYDTYGEGAISKFKELFDGNGGASATPQVTQTDDDYMRLYQKYLAQQAQGVGSGGFAYTAPDVNVQMPSFAPSLNVQSEGIPPHILALLLAGVGVAGYAVGKRKRKKKYKGRKRRR